MSKDWKLGKSPAAEAQVVQRSEVRGDDIAELCCAVGCGCGWNLNSRGSEVAVWES